MRRSLATTLALALAAASLAAGCSQAGPGPLAATQSATAAPSARAYEAPIAQADRARFRRADRDGDGFLSPDELPQLTPAQFRALDRNGDGRLSFDEATAGLPAVGLRAQVAAEFEAARAASAARGESPASRAPGEAAMIAAKAPAPLHAGKLSPVVLIPGYLDLEVYFDPIKSKLEAQGHPTHYVDLFPNVSDIAGAAAILAKQVAQVKAQTGASQVDLVGHSMGGLIARYYLQNLGGSSQVGHLITLSTPHHGTIVALAGPGEGASEMHPGSAFLQALNAGDLTPGAIRFTSVRGGFDEIVIPHSSPIMPAPWTNVECPHAMHGSVFLDAIAWQAVDRGLQ